LNLFGWTRCFCTPFMGSSLNTTSSTSVVGIPSPDGVVNREEVAKQDKRKQQVRFLKPAGHEHQGCFRVC
jgi:hypothetical protein